MKKFLLSLAAVIGLGFAANAETVTFDFSKETYGAGPAYTDSNTAYVSDDNVATSDGVTVTFSGDSQAWRFWSDGIRAYKNKNAAFTVAAGGKTITAITWTVKSGATFALDGTTENITSWTGSAQSVKFNYTNTSGNLALITLSVTFGDGTGGGTTEPDQPSNPGEKEEVDFDFSQATYGAGPAYSDSNTAYVSTDNVATSENGLVTVTFTGSSQAWRFWSDGIRAYKNKNATFTVAATSGKVTSVSWTVKSGATFALEGTTEDITSWTGSAESVSFVYTNTSSNLALITLKVTIEGGEAPAVAVPKISCENNMVTITAAEGADIYYTLDGTTPTTASTKYSAPFAITENTTVKAIAYVGDEASSVATYTAVYVGNYAGFEALVKDGANAEGTVDGPITAIYQNGQYLYVVDNKNYPMLVYGSIGATLNNGDKIADINCKYSPYNGLPEVTNPVLGEITTGGAAIEPQALTAAPTEALINCYVVMNNATLTSSAAMTFAGESVVLYNRFTGVTIPSDFNKVYNVTGFVSIYNGTIQVYPTAFEEVLDANQVETPVITCANNTVTITCATEDATIYYTIDGTEPTDESEEYTEPFEITETVTVKAIAVKEDMNDSYVATVTCNYVDPNATYAMFNFADPASLTCDPAIEIGDATEINMTNVTISSGVISIVGTAPEGASASSSPRLFQSSGSNVAWSYRFYKDNTITIKAENGYLITSIEFVSTNLTNSSIVWSNGTFSDNTWTPSSTQTLAEDDTVVNGVAELTISKTETGNNPTITSMKVNYIKDTSSAVGSIDTENGEAVYFNLQGVRVNNPERGIYIKVQNGKASKVIK